MKKIRKIIALSIATVMLSLSSITVFASSSLNVTPLEDANDFSELKSDSFSEGIPLPKSAYSRANMQFTSGSLHYSDTLTSDDSTDLYFFLFHQQDLHHLQLAVLIPITLRSS